MEDIDKPVDVPLWNDNWPAIQLFTRMSSQWRVGMNGPTGLDMNVALALMGRMNLSDEAFNDLYDMLSVIESFALAELHKR